MSHVTMKFTKGYIYKLTSPSGKVYIGQTIRNPQDRFQPYRNGKGTNPYFTNALLKYGFESFNVEVYEVPVFMLNYIETSLIRNFDSRNRKYGYNSREGGSRGSISEEQKSILRIVNTGKLVSEDTREKIRQKATGRTASEETKAKLRVLNAGKNNPMFGKRGKDHPKTGKVVTETTRKKLSVLKKGKNNPMFGKNGGLNPNSKKVYVYGVIYDSCIDASRALHFLFPERNGNFINVWTRSKTHPEIFLFPSF